MTRKHALALLALVAIVPMTVWQLYVTTVLWGWFAVPMLHVPQFGMMQLAGLCMTWRAFTGAAFRKEKKEEDDEEEAGMRIIGAIVFGIAAPATALGFGYLFLRLS